MDKTDLLEEIRKLRRRNDAVVLAHTYQPGEIQDLADYVGDSYGLSVAASRLGDAGMIVFCGVRFMAETAAILNPDKPVVMPREDAGCPMADMIDAEQLRRFKQEHPGAVVLCYVNSTAEVKAESDICCTSSNALRIVERLPPDQKVLFVPDQHLGRYVRNRLHRPMVLWQGFCPVHQKLRAEGLAALKRRHPGVPVMVHPETCQAVQDLADHVLSTGQMIDEVGKAPGGSTFIVGTEKGIIHALEKENPDKTFIHAEPGLICRDMKKTTLENLRDCLRNKGPRVVVDPEIAARARKSIGRMLELSR